MGLLSELQSDTQAWREKNFPPEHRTAELQALGVCEEAGELAHSVLKRFQGIRGTDAEHLAAIEDAAGDITIYLCGLFSSLGLDYEAAVSKAWTNVQQRDWQANPMDGRTDVI